jgi:hypothetical protein
VDVWPGYIRDMMPELGKAMAGMQARAEELNVKTLFVVNAAPEHVAYGPFEADDAYSPGLLFVDMPLRQDFKVSAVEYQENLMKRAMAEAAARG